MTARPQSWIVDSAGFAGAAPRLSVLVPFHRDDPAPLLSALEREAAAGSGAFEVLLLDDGSGDEALTARTARAASQSPAPTRLISLAVNEGRARGRNRLMAAARAERLLFLDADMLPDRPDFLAAWLALIDRLDPAVAFGGFTVERAPHDPARRLHRALSQRGDCRPAAERARAPAKSLCTSNLLVRRDVLAAEPFDEGFSGWGWEDVEWAIRVGSRFPILHVDNSASHLGLDTDRALIAKWEQSVANFARMAARHPEAVAAFPVRRMSRRLAGVPARAAWRPLLRDIATGPAPLALRVAAAKLYRAALYADAP